MRSQDTPIQWYGISKCMTLSFIACVPPIISDHQASEFTVMSLSSPTTIALHDTNVSLPVLEVKSYLTSFIVLH